MMAPPRGFEENFVSASNAIDNEKTDSEGWTDGGISPEKLLIQVVQAWGNLSSTDYKRIKAILDEAASQRASS